MWIAFNYYVSLIPHNPRPIASVIVSVVNCFQLLCIFDPTQPACVLAMFTFVVNCFQLLCIFDPTQRVTITLWLMSSCELLSIIMYLWSHTTKDKENGSVLQLWIAFNYYVSLIPHNQHCNLYSDCSVVNCFQLLCIFDPTQRMWHLRIGFVRCELLSIIMYLWSHTTAQPFTSVYYVLWIAFNYYVSLIPHNQISSYQ